MEKVIYGVAHCSTQPKKAKRKILKISKIERYSFEFQNYFVNIALNMRIVSHRRLVEFYSSEGHGDAQAALERWYDIAEKAEWKNLYGKDY